MEYRKKINVRFADIDSMGHVNNATYLSYFEEARIDYFEKSFDGEWDWQKDGIILVKNEVEYLVPIFLNDKVEVLTKIINVGTKSFTFGFEVFKISEKGNILCSNAAAVLVCYDNIKMTSKPIPEQWRNKMLTDLV